MGRKSWEKMAAVAGIIFLAAAVALMPTCGGGGGGSTGPTGGACDLLSGDWLITTTGKATGNCGGLRGLADEPAVITISGDQLTLEFTDLMLSASGTVTCTGEAFDYTGADPGYPDVLCSTTLTLANGNFTSDNEFTAALVVEITDYPPSTCGSPCTLSQALTAVRQ